MRGDYGGCFQIPLSDRFSSTIPSVRDQYITSPLSSACSSPRNSFPAFSNSLNNTSPQPVFPSSYTFPNDLGPSSPYNESDPEDKYSGTDSFRPAPSSRITRSDPLRSEVPPMKYDSDSEVVSDRYDKVTRRNHRLRVEFFNRSREAALSNGENYLNKDNNILELDFGEESDSDDSDFTHKSFLSSDNSNSSSVLEVSN